MTDTPRPSAESPKTEAGRALSDMGPAFVGGMTFTQLDEHILAIEAEAAALSDSAHAIEALPFLDMNTDDGGGGRMVALDAVLALLAQPTQDAEPEVTEEWVTNELQRLNDIVPFEPKSQPTQDDKPSLDAVTAWLQSPEAESRLAEALKATVLDYRYSQAFAEGRARAILAALTKP